MRIVRAMGWTAILVGVTACGGDEADIAEDEIYDDEAPPVEAVEEPVPIATEYAPGLNVDLEAMTPTESGLRYRVLQEGSGERIEPGQTAVVHYTGWLPDGTEFDSSRARAQPFDFVVGAGQVIRGWDEGVAGMTSGEKRQLVIPSGLGYGAGGAGDVIPPNATLVFEVELLEIR